MQTLLFDLDGTILDSKPGIISSYRRTFEVLGLPEPADYDVYIGPPIHQIMTKLIGVDRAAEGVKLFRGFYGETGMFECDPFDGIREVLKSLDARLYIATSKAHAYARRMLEHHGLETQFLAIHGAELDGTRADKGELISYILKTEGLDPTCTTMIGDREHDAIGARKNGIPCWGVAWGYAAPGELEAAGVRAVLKHPSELRQWLASSSS